MPRGMGSGKASWKRGHLLRPTAGVELTRERWQKVLQAEAAECAKEEKTKHRNRKEFSGDYKEREQEMMLER